MQEAEGTLQGVSVALPSSASLPKLGISGPVPEVLCSTGWSPHPLPGSQHVFYGNQSEMSSRGLQKGLERDHKAIRAAGITPLGRASGRMAA